MFICSANLARMLSSCEGYRFRWFSLANGVQRYFPYVGWQREERVWEWKSHGNNKIIFESKIPQLKAFTWQSHGMYVKWRAKASHISILYIITFHYGCMSIRTTVPVVFSPLWATNCTDYDGNIDMKMKTTLLYTTRVLWGCLIFLFIIITIIVVVAAVVVVVIIHQNNVSFVGMINVITLFNINNCWNYVQHAMNEWNSLQIRLTRSKALEICHCRRTIA